MCDRESRSVVARLLLLAATFAGPVAAQEPKSNGLRDDERYNALVEEFIQYDIGNVREPAAVDRIRRQFNSLKADEAVPALVRGLNRSMRMGYSCPITAISGKLMSMMQSSRNPEVGKHILANLEQRDVGRYNHHIANVRKNAEGQMIRILGREQAERQFKRRVEDDAQKMAYVPGMKLTDLAPRQRAASGPASDATANDASINANRTSDATGKPASPTTTPPAADLGKLTVAQLAERLNDKSGQARVLRELSMRASDGNEAEVAALGDSIVQSLSEGNESARMEAARLLGVLRLEWTTLPLITALEDSSPAVRSAATTALTRITRQLFGPADDATPAQQKQAVARWRNWWEKRQQAKSAR
jgi:hypothetical protein